MTISPITRNGGAVALGLAFALGAAGEAAAQVCAGDLPTVPNSNVGGIRIVCQESNPSASGIRINAESVSLSVTSSNFAFRPAIDARLNSASDANGINVRLGRGLVISTGAAREAFIGAYARNAGSGATRIVMEDGASITTTGGDADGIRYSNPTAATGTVDVQMTGGSITTSGSEAHGIYILHNGSGASTVSMSGGAIKASGSRSSGIYVNKQRGSGDATITFSGGSIEKSGGDGAGIGFYGDPAANAANARIRVTGGSIAVEGIANTHGVHVDHRSAGGGDVAMTGGSITTKGGNSHGVFATLRNAANEAPVVIGMAGGSITTEGQTALGLYGVHFGLGSVTVTMEGEAEITTSGDGAHGVSALLFNAANEAAIVVGMAGGSVATEGAGAAGLNGLHLGLGSVTVTTGGEAEIESPFFVGVRGWLSNDANAAGRLVVTHGGAVEAGDAGVLAWAARRSGHTSGDGAEEADDAARTEPMIHVTSSGDVTVGASVTDAFIRNRIAGDDGTLSAGEQAVLDAITADDSDALTTALEALPADYDDDWKAEAENLRRKRAVLTDDETSANRAAGKILGLTRAGVRALALSHETITGHVRSGDGDGALSAAEWTALEAALTGRGLETALAALPAAYTDTWKDTLRAHAASYNAGDIQVDVTGGTITAEGDGVDARYALAHDRNGAITVTVADGAEITGGRHGVHVGGAGLAAGNDDGLRDQTVTVNGKVMGGTGAGVHLAGGGTVTVGGTGRVGAASGDAVLSDGAGDLSVTVAGAVEGDIRNMGGGALRFASEAGSEVTGTVHDPVGPLTVRGSVGRLLYAGGATVTVARTGRIAGISGEAIRSAAGDLSVTVAGAVEGDILGAGDLSATISGTVDGNVFGRGAGEHTVTVSNGGTVTGAIHLAASTVTVHGAAGQVRFDNGGAVTVGATGRIGGIEGVAVRNAAGALSVAVAAGGRIEGDIVDLGDRPARVETEAGSTVMGTIDVTGKDSAVTVGGTAGRVRFGGDGRVTVGANGRITGDEAITSGGRLVVVIRERPGEGAREVIRRIPGAMRDEGGGPEVTYRASDGTDTRLGDPDSTRSVPDGAFDVGVERAEGGGLKLAYRYAPRARVYEALPSALLRLNGLPEFRERMAAGAARGGWALVESFRGKQRAESSKTTGLGYDHSRYGVRAGFRGPVSENGLFGVSAHRRGGSAKVSNGGKIDLSGAGVGISWTARLDEAAYMDLQAEWTWYEADMASSGRGSPKGGAAGRGHAVGMEVGRRTVAGGVVLTPRISMTRSTVSMNDFSDSVGARVSLTGGRSLKGRAGIGAATDAVSGIRMFGSVDAEREFSKERKVTVSGTELRSTVEPMWVRLKLGGVHAWGDGRYALRGAASWATGGDSYEFGGVVDLTARF